MSSIEMEFAAIQVSSSVGTIPRPGNNNEVMVCQYLHMTNSMGCSWFGCDPFSFSMPVIMAQMIIIFLVTATIYFFLKPFQQSTLSAQLLAGIMMTPILAHYEKTASQLFPPEGRLILETVANVAFTLHLFIIGVQIDPSLFKRMGKNSIVIGFTTFAVPYALSEFTAFTLPHFVTVDESVQKTLPFVGALGSMTTFPAITGLLMDLNMLNSELGRLATKAAMVADVCNYIMSLTMISVGMSLQLQQWKPMYNVFWLPVFVLVILYVVRPIVLSIAKRIPKNQEITENHFISIIGLVLMCGFFSECLGHNASLGAFMMGIGVPDGPPLGASLVNKLDILTTGILLPAKFVISGLVVDLNSIGGQNSFSSVIILLVIGTGCLSKFLTTFTLAFHYAVPFLDAVSLSLIMSSKGILDVAAYMITHTNGVITDQEYTLLILCKLVITGITRYFVWRLYDPSTRYLGFMRNSILQSHNPGSVLRMLICIHNEDDVPTTINLLEASTPTKIRPITVSTLNLLELAGRSTSILVPNFSRDKASCTHSRASQIINAFSFFVERNKGCVLVEHFTSIAPYASMHEDICTIALDKGANIIIVPFHKCASIDGKLDGFDNSGPIRTVNLNVVQKSPCSVGIFVDRGRMSGNQMVLSGFSTFCVTQLFLGGADDREALAYSTRMADHPCISLTLIWLRPHDHGLGSFREEYEHDKNLDIEMIRRFKANVMGKKGVVFREEVLRDAVATTKVLRSVSEEDGCDLVIVGRDHEAQYQLIQGLIEWSECPELGAVGDMLATSDSRFSVLVVQQQPLGPVGLDQTGKYAEERAFG